ncbi:ArnT family glycosyltransferase [Flavobacteriaceae bacterium M23B6Z8]
MTQWFTNNPIKTILLAGIFIFLLHLQILPVTIMEARNFITAREMVNDGNWLLTTMNGLPRYEKPPLPTWLTALSGKFLGISNVYALRLPTALMAIFTALMVFKFSLKLTRDRQQSLINGLVLITSFYIIAITNEAPWDIYAHGFMLTASYFYFSIFKELTNVWRNVFLAAFFTGLSFLSKGPVSLYALFLPFLLAYGFAYGYRGFKRKRFPLVVCILVTIVVSLWWYWYVRMADPDSFLEIAQKETGNWSSYNVRPFYYYWSFFTQSGVWTIPAFFALFYPLARKKVIHPKAYLFSFLWTILSVVLLSVIPEKKTRYLSPVLIPMAMNTGFYLVYLIRKFKEMTSWKERTQAYFIFGIIALIGFAFPIAGYLFLEELTQKPWLWYSLTSAALVVLSIAMIYYLIKKELFKVFLLTIAFVMSITSFGLPIAESLKTNPAYVNVQVLDEEKPPGLPVFSFGELAPEILWHYGSKIADLESETSAAMLEELDNFGVLVNVNEEERFKRIFESEYDLERTQVFDLNYAASPDEKKHKKRLVSHYYSVSK